MNQRDVVNVERMDVNHSLVVVGCLVHFGCGGLVIGWENEWRVSDGRVKGGGGRVKEGGGMVSEKVRNWPLGGVDVKILALSLTCLSRKEGSVDVVVEIVDFVDGDGLVGRNCCCC